jgi:hypothetical protein
MEIRNKDWYKKANELHNIQCKIKELTEIKSNLLDSLVKMSDEKDSKYEGLEFKKLVRPGSIKYSRIPELKFLDLDKYREGDVTFWKLYKKY